VERKRKEIEVGGGGGGKVASSVKKVCLDFF
jgi:hypothetical protein